MPFLQTGAALTLPKKGSKANPLADSTSQLTQYRILLILVGSLRQQACMLLRILRWEASQGVTLLGRQQMGS